MGRRPDPVLAPESWEQAPKGEALVEAILAAYRASPWHPHPMPVARTFPPHPWLTAMVTATRLQLISIRWRVGQIRGAPG